MILSTTPAPSIIAGRPSPGPVGTLLDRLDQPRDRFDAMSRALGPGWLSRARTPRGARLLALAAYDHDVSARAVATLVTGFRVTDGPEVKSVLDPWARDGYDYVKFNPHLRSYYVALPFPAPVRAVGVLDRSLCGAILAMMPYLVSAVRGYPDHDYPTDFHPTRTDTHAQRKRLVRVLRDLKVYYSPWGYRVHGLTPSSQSDPDFIAPGLLPAKMNDHTNRNIQYWLFQSLYRRGQ